MTNQAIIIIQPSESSTPLPLQNINGKAFLHYQLQFLSDNIFEHIVLLYSDDKEKYEAVFGDSYLGMRIIYLPYKIDKGQSGNIITALQHISKPYVFVFNANNYFKLNLTKADNFRRMRDSKILLIGKKAEGRDILSKKLFLNVKGKIANITDAKDTEDKDTFNTETWLLNTEKFTELFEGKNHSIFNDYFEVEYKSTPLFCLACRQYFINITNSEDIEKAKHDFEENYY